MMMMMMMMIRTYCMKMTNGTPPFLIMIDDEHNYLWWWYKSIFRLMLHCIILEGAGATLATVLWSDTSNYCAVSSVAAPPRHPAPSISNTSNVRVGARETNVPCWCARVWFRDMSWVVRVLASSRVKIYLTCARSTIGAWEGSEVARTKNEASLLVRERRRTERMVARGETTKRDWKNVVARL